MNERPNYVVTVTRADGLWTATVAGLPPRVVGAIDVENFARIEEDVHELIADLTDSSPGQFDVSWRYQVGEVDVTALVTEFVHAQREASRAEAALRERDEVRRRLVRELAGPLSQRAIADMVQVSHQRVNQIKRGA